MKWFVKGIGEKKKGWCEMDLSFFLPFFLLCPVRAFCHYLRMVRLNGWAGGRAYVPLGHWQVSRAGIGEDEGGTKRFCCLLI